MDKETAGKRIISEIEKLLSRDSFISTNFRVENSGEWKKGRVTEYHERIVLYPEDLWIDSCGNGFAIEYYLVDEKAHLVFGVRSPYTAPRNMEFTEELASFMENNLKSHGLSYETLSSSEKMDSYWRIWTELGSPEAEDFDIGKTASLIYRLMNEVFIEREKIVRPDYLIF